MKGKDVNLELSELAGNSDIYDPAKMVGMIERVLKISSFWGDSVPTEAVQGVLDALLEEARKPLSKGKSSKLH